MHVKREWSEYQKAIFEDIATGKGHTMIEALAGSGKTSTLIESLKYIPKRKTVLLVAFGKKNADTLKERAPQYTGLHISTLHSLGFAAIRNAFGKSVKMDPKKSFRIVQKLLAKYKKHEKEKDDYITIFEMCRAVSLCKSYIVDAPAKVDDLLDEFDISTCGFSRDEFIKKIIFILAECKKDKKSVDYDDMIYFPFVFNMPVGRWDYVLTDEYQDLSLSQAFIVRSACKHDGRIILAGDKNQAIFAWRGGDIDVVDFKNKLNAKVLPLPISYRCANKIVYEAQKIVPGIKPAPGAIDGEVIRIAEKELFATIKCGDFLLSRTNAPLVKWCMKFLRAKIPANIQSKDVSVSFISLIKQSNKKTVKSFIQWLDVWKDGEIKRFEAKGKDTSIIEDKYECMINLCDGEDSLDVVRANIKLMFNDCKDNDIITLGSIHGVKGDERSRVFILENSYNPKYAHLQEEKNLRYVACTRAREKLFYVSKV